MQEQNKFRYIYNNEEVSREEFEKLAGDSFKWFDGDSIVSVPFSSFDSFFNGKFKSSRQINDHLDSVLNVYQNKVTEDIINKPKCSPQCYCDGSCKKPQEKKLGGYNKPTIKGSSTRHKSQSGETHKEIVGDLEGINRPPSTHNGLEKYINSLKKLKDDVITSSNRGEKETMEYLQNVEEDVAYDYTIGNQETQVVEWINKVTREKEKIRIYKDVWYSNYPMHEPPFVLVELDKNADKKETMEGLKYNNLKPSLDIVINRQFPKALQLIALATEYGHNKYIENDSNYLNYKSVKGGSQTYFDASARHSTDRNGLDESGLPHIIHAVWSSLAGLELWAEENNINVKEFTENFMKNLHNSK